MAAMSKILHDANAQRQDAVQLRPHFKNHRVLELARRQMAAGACGIAVSRLRHAEALVEAGVTGSVLLTSEVATEQEFKRAAALSSRCELIVAVDSVALIDGLAKAAAGAPVGVAIEVDLGLARTGVPAAEAIALGLRAVTAGLRLRGLTAYEGHLQREAPSAGKRERCSRAMEVLAGVRAEFQAAGLPVEIVSAGGTGTCGYAAANPAITEIQAGCYLLSETNYEAGAPEFSSALTVLATAVSVRQERAIFDAGLKVLSSERGLGCLQKRPKMRVTALHAEHAIVQDQSRSERGRLMPRVGEKVQLTVPYSDGTVNLNRTLWGVRNGLVEEAFSIEW